MFFFIFYTFTVFCSSIQHRTDNLYQSRNLQEEISSSFKKIAPKNEKPQHILQVDNQGRSISHDVEELSQKNWVDSNLQDYNRQERKKRIKRAKGSSSKSSGSASRLLSSIGSFLSKSFSSGSLSPILKTNPAPPAKSFSPVKSSSSSGSSSPILKTNPAPPSKSFSPVKSSSSSGSSFSNTGTNSHSHVPVNSYSHYWSRRSSSNSSNIGAEQFTTAFGTRPTVLFAILLAIILINGFRTER